MTKRLLLETLAQVKHEKIILVSRVWKCFGEKGFIRGKKFKLALWRNKRSHFKVCAMLDSCSGVSALSLEKIAVAPLYGMRLAQLQARQKRLDFVQNITSYNLTKGATSHKKEKRNKYRNSSTTKESHPE